MYPIKWYEWIGIGFGCLGLCFLGYVCMTDKGRKLMERFDNWMGKILK